MDRVEAAVSPAAWSNSDRRSRLPDDWKTRRVRVLKRDGWACRMRGSHCTGRATEVDHIVAGDNHDLSNLQALCHNCHVIKTQAESRAVIAAKAKGRTRVSERHPGWT